MYTKLRLIRREAEWTQLELSRASGISQEVISRLELGITRNAMHRTLIDLAVALSKRLSRKVELSEMYGPARTRRAAQRGRPVVAASR